MNEKKAKKLINDVNTLLVKSDSKLEFRKFEDLSYGYQISIEFTRFVSYEILQTLKRYFKADNILIFDNGNIYLTIFK